MLDALAAALPELTVRGAAAGLYLVLELPESSDEAAVLAAARARGIALEGRGSGHPALVLGYAAVDAAGIEPAVAVLAESIRSSAGERRELGESPVQEPPLVL
jgi:GntR family transcriptional regulator/MocR family aminotransferase